MPENTDEAVEKDLTQSASSAAICILPTQRSRATAYLRRVLQVIEPVVIPEEGKISGTVMAKKAGTE